ncbi:MAG: rhomboid family intramembrane serine protease, partial [Dokdonella sp.]
MFINLPSRRKPRPPWVNLFVVATSVVCFLWLATLPVDNRTALINQWGTVPTTLLDTTAPWLQIFTELRAARLVSALFIHADWLHLIGNLLFLIIFGVPSERALGSARFLALFLICGALANLVGAWTLAGTSGPIIGSSGAVSAVVGAYLALFPSARLGLVLPLGLYLEFVRIPAPILIGVWILLQLVFTFVGPAFGAVAWWTHIAGFCFGILFAMASRSGIRRR